MKTCRCPLGYIYLDHFNGNVWLRQWMLREESGAAHPARPFPGHSLPEGTRS